MIHHQNITEGGPQQYIFYILIHKDIPDQTPFFHTSNKYNVIVTIDNDIVNN